MKMKLLLLSFIFSLYLCWGCSKQNDDSIIQPQQQTREGQFLDDFTYEVFPSVDDNFEKAVFRLLIPTDIDTLRALTILTPGINQDGTGLVLQDDWIDFAEREHLGLLGVFFFGVPNSQRDYRYAENGSGSALVEALNTIAQKNSIPQISTLPFVMWGFSAGGSFTYGFSAYMPERVVCFAIIKSGTYFSTQGSENRNIPALMIAGELNGNLTSMKSWFLKKRMERGIWGFAIEPNSGHEIGKSNELIRPFFISALEKRISKNPSDPRELLFISEETGWLGNLETFNIAAYAEYSGDKLKAAWLMDENIAKTWQNFVTDEDVTFREE